MPAAKASATLKMTPRDRILELQIRTRKLPFLVAKKGRGFCCGFSEPMKLDTMGRCAYCRTDTRSNDCLCTKTEVCLYHDKSVCYACGEFVNEVGHWDCR